MIDRIWISWNEQRRNIGLAAAVNARLYMSDRKTTRWCRIFREFLESWKLIRRERPSICFTMNPSVFASWWLSLLAKIYRFHLVSDVHSVNIKITGLRKVLFRMFFNAGIRRSDAIIVTNEIYRQYILPLNPNVVCVPDPLPVLRTPLMNNRTDSVKISGKMQVLLICSFDPDEPLSEVLAMDFEINDFEILVTGDWKKRFEAPPSTKNIRFLGFVCNEEYDRLLCAVDGIMVLSTEEGCLCCGAYEAVSAGKPLILSRTKALRDFFGKAPIYTENSSESIISALWTLNAEIKQRAKMIVQERAMLSSKFNSGIKELEKVIACLK